jgi:acetyl-CoA synthetase
LIRINVRERRHRIMARHGLHEVACMSSCSSDVATTARPGRIAKHVNDLRPLPHLLDYAETCAGFSWERASSLLDGLPGGRGINIAHEAVDRHVHHGRGSRTAIRWLGEAGERRELSYADLSTATNRFANALATLGVASGERVFVLLGRVPELHVALLGALKARCVVTPLFSAFGPEPFATRWGLGVGCVVVSTPELYRRMVQG